jgi:hypothetical protein
MRQRREHELDVLKRRVVGRDVLDRLAAHTHARASLLVRRSERQRKLRVLRDEPTKLLPRVPACAEDPNTDSIHA